MPAFSSLTDRIAGEGAEAWAIHSAALARQEAGEDVIILSIGDPDFDTDPRIKQAASDALAAGDTHYVEVIGREPLRRLIAERFTAAGGCAAGPDNVLILAGAQNALFTASMILLEPGDEVIILEPAYVTYEATLGASGAEVVRVPPRGDGSFRPDATAIAAAVTARTKAIAITNPNNPTGVVMTTDELEAIAGIARAHDLWVISDEVYGALVFQGSHHPIAGLPGMAERTVTLASLSKSHAMTGWRAGWMVAPTAVVNHGVNLSLAMLYGLPGFVQQAAAVALQLSDEIIARDREIYRRRRDKLVAALRAIPGLGVLDPQAGMFAMIDVRSFGLSGTDFAWGLLEQEAVSVLDCQAFGASAAGWLRVSFVGSETDLENAAHRIGQYCARLAGHRRISVGL